MRIAKILFCLLLISTFIQQSTPMNPADTEEESNWATALFNKLKKKADPIGYATNNKARKYYNDALLYNPSRQEHRKLNLDDHTKTVISKITSRMIVANDILREIVESKDPDHSSLETLLEAKRSMPGFFSECDDAILLGLHNWRRNIHKRIVKDLSYYVETNDDSQTKSVVLTPSSTRSELDVTPVTLKILATKSFSWWPSGLYAATINYFSKHYIFPIDHITTVESSQMCNGLLYFNPQHPDHSKDAEFTLNPDLEWQRLLVKKVLEREKIYLTNLAYNLLKDKRPAVMKLSRPKEANANSTVPSCLFTDVSDALCGGYLTYVKNNAPVDSKPIADKSKQEELRKKAAEEAAKKTEEEQQRLAEEKLKQEQELKKMQEEKQRFLETVDTKKIEDEIERRAQEIAAKKIEEERKTREEAEKAFKAAEEKKQAELATQREAKLKALEDQSTPGSTNSSAAPTVVAATPSAPTHQVYQGSEVPKVEQKPEDVCACNSKKLYKNCCGKSKPLGTPPPPTSKPAAKQPVA